jgi:ribosomal-protein-alanine N-acetyltransferase
VTRTVTEQPRVYIRRVARSDEKEFTHLMRDSQYLHEPWISPPTNAVLFRHYLQRISREDHEGFVICRKQDDRIVGAININHIVRGSFLSASLGYYVGAEFQGNGYMAEGLQLLTHYAFNTLGLHRLEANIQPDNTRSQQLVRRCGFKKEGYSEAFLFINGAWRDHERWCCVHPRAELRNHQGRSSMEEENILNKDNGWST